MVSKDFKWENTSALPHATVGKLSWEIFFMRMLLWKQANTYHNVIISFSVEITFEVCEFLSL